MGISSKTVEVRELSQWGHAKFVEKRALVDFGGTEKMVTRGVIEGPSGANVLPYFLSDGVYYVILVEQYRIAVGTVTWEAPGGVVDSGDARLTMARELEEEAGVKIDPERIEIVFKEYLLPSLTNAFGWGGIVEIKKDDLPSVLIHGKQQEGEFTLLIVEPLAEIIEIRKEGKLFFDLWTSRLINEVAQKTGTSL